MIKHGDALTVLQGLDDESVHCCVTSPPYYGLRDYGLPPTMWPAIDYSPIPGLGEIHIPEWEGCLGLEPTIEMFIGHIVLIFREVRRVLRKDGTLWMNFGDSYAGGGRGDGSKGNKQKTNLGSLGFKPQTPPDGLKSKDLMGIPWRAAFALQADGWFLRLDIIWHKLNPMPESVTDRPAKAHEYIFLLSRSRRYHFDAEAIKEPISASSEARLSQDLESQSGSDRANGGRKTNGPMKAVIGKGNSKTFRGGGAYTNNRSFSNSAQVERESSGNRPNETGLRNKRSVWSVATAQYKEAHFATFPPELIRPCILAGCPVGGVTLDPFHGSGTTGQVALEENRDFIGIDLNPDYIEIQKRRISNVQVKMII